LSSRSQVLTSSDQILLLIIKSANPDVKIQGALTHALNIVAMTHLAELDLV